MRTDFVLIRAHQANKALKDLLHKEKELALELLATTYRKEAGGGNRSESKISPAPTNKDVHDITGNEHWLNTALYEIDRLKRLVFSVNKNQEAEFMERVNNIETLLNARAGKEDYSGLGVEK